MLKNITDYLIEEASAEEEELLGQSADQEEGQVEEVATVERDDQLIKVSIYQLFFPSRPLFFLLLVQLRT